MTMPVTSRPAISETQLPCYKLEEISKTWLDAVACDDVSDVKSITNLLFNVD
jgi:hypothetical protein